ncbi:MAG: hypothetical protein ABJE95_21985 [Byssovorax sp.]
MISPPGSRSRSALGAALALAFASLPACSTSLPKPPGGIVPTSAMIEVPYPPPAARVETIPEKKTAGQIWIDGQWEWDAKAWKWRDGAWTTAPPNAYFTPWTTKRRADGQLLFARAEWRDPSGRPLNVDDHGQVCAVLVPAPVAEVTRP